MSESEESGSESEVTEMVVGRVVNVGSEIDVGVPAGELADDAEPDTVGPCEAGAELEAALLGRVTDVDASVPEVAALVVVDVGDPFALVSVACRLQ